MHTAGKEHEVPWVAHMRKEGRFTLAYIPSS